MSLSLPVGSALDPWKQPPGDFGRTPLNAAALWPPCHAAAQLVRAFTRWQIQRLERRMAAFQPDDRFLH